MLSEKFLFKLEDIEYGKPKVFDVSYGLIVNISGFGFEKNLVSKIQVVKYDLRERRNSKEFYCIELFSGNIEIGSVMPSEDFVFKVRDGYYRIRKAISFDYKNLEKQEEC